MHWPVVSSAPRISVLISSYSNARFVGKKIAEIERQSCFPHAEFLFIETGSPERERDLFQPFCARHQNCRLIVTEDRKTLYQAWNIGWNAARAPLVCYSNMDDCMHPLLLESVAAAMESHCWEAATVLIAKQEMDAQWNDWSAERIRRLPLSTRGGPFAAWRRELAGTLGQFDERYIAAGDKEFWHRLASRGAVGLVPKILYLYTRNPRSLSQTLRQSERWRAEKALMEQAQLQWPAALRRKIRALRLWRALVPGFGFVPAPESAVRPAP